MPYVNLNYLYYAAILGTIYLKCKRINKIELLVLNINFRIHLTVSKQKSSGSFKNIY